MKAVKVILFIFCMSLFASSCTNDEPLAKVKYQITGLDSSVAEIRYTNALGGTTIITDFNKFSGGKDSKTLSVNFIPFDSYIQVSVNNSTSTIKNYILVIYVNGVVKASSSLVAPPTSITTGEVNFTVE